MTDYAPEGIEFYDKVRGRMMLLVTAGSLKGWLCYRHPDGQWVTLREVTSEDLSALRYAGFDVEKELE